MSVHALGLGDMKVKSALDQPFLAEIELIDTQSVRITDVKAALANPKNFEHLGIVPSESLGLLYFDVKKNEQGRFVVMIHSIERMSEPYIQLVVDLIWPKGQLYKAYTVLLDPPGYKLVVRTAQSGPTHHKQLIRASGKKKTTLENNPGVDTAESPNNDLYGPTTVNENVWQIAQHYKTSETILPQVVLAFVGKNPQAFSNGNLNGLNVGERLKIPSVLEILKVPADLATVEVMAHDKAWNEKTSIDHVLAPPYINGQTATESPAIEYSKIPPVPQLAQSTFVRSQSMSQSMQPSIQNQTPVNTEQDAMLKAEISITSAAVDSLRESNSMLLEQLHIIQEENKRLHGQLEQRDKEINLIRNQIRIMKKERQSLVAQTSSSAANNSSSNWWPLILLLGIVGGSGVVGVRYFKRREEQESDELGVTPTPEPVQIPAPKTASEEPVKEELVTPLEPESPAAPEPQAKEEEFASIPVHSRETVAITDESEYQVDEDEPQRVEESPQDNLLEFESGLHQLISEEKSTKAMPTQDVETTASDSGLEFTQTSSVELEAPHKVDEKTNTKAFDTLLDLAQTYIGMDDLDSALNSLNEVVEAGTPSQKEKANQLIDEIKKKQD